MKDKILALLQGGKDLTLTQIQEQIGKLDKDKPMVLYHLRGLVGLGKIRKNEDKTYSFIDVAGVKTLNIEYIGEAKAGVNDKFHDDSAPKEYIPVAVSMISHSPEDLLLVKVSGDSMAPTFNEGNLLMFKKIKEGDIIDSKIIVCRVDGGLKIKRYKDMGNYGLLLSDNYNQEHPENHPIVIDGIKDFQPLGRYVSQIN